MDSQINYTVDINSPTEDPFVYYSDEFGRKLKGRIQLVKPGFWGSRGKMILFLDSIKKWDSNPEIELTIDEYVLALQRIAETLDKHDLNLGIR